MPITPSYLGVHVQSVVQAGPPLVDGPTSVTAFIGRARRGPRGTPIPLNGWAGYQRRFGGLLEESSVSHQVAAFFETGGGRP